MLPEALYRLIKVALLKSQIRYNIKIYRTRAHQQAKPSEFLQATAPIFSSRLLLSA